MLVTSLLALAIASGRPVSRVARAPAAVRMATVAPSAAAPVAAPDAVEMAVCPETAWGSPLDIREAQRKLRESSLAEFPLEIEASSVVGASVGDTNAELAYFREHASELRAAMVTNGAVLLRGFELTKSPEGFQTMCAPPSRGQGRQGCGALAGAACAPADPHPPPRPRSALSPCAQVPGGWPRALPRPAALGGRAADGEQGRRRLRGGQQGEPQELLHRCAHHTAERRGHPTARRRARALTETASPRRLLPFPP